MADLSGLFTDIQKDKKKYLSCETGGDFEGKIEERLRKIGYSKLSESGIKDSGINMGGLNKVSQEINRSDLLANETGHENWFIVQPSGSQNYPDFMVFDKTTIKCIETKYSKNKQRKPVWNSGLPRPNGIYVFASYGIKDITFFMGRDIVSADDIEKLHGFFDELKEKQDCFNFKEMANQPYGFTAYNRKAFDQQKKVNKNAIIDYFDNPNREDLEESVIDYVKNEETEKVL